MGKRFGTCSTSDRGKALTARSIVVAVAMKVLKQVQRPVRKRMAADRSQLPAPCFPAGARTLDPIVLREAIVVHGHALGHLIGLGGRLELPRSNERVQIRDVIEDPAADADEARPYPVASPSRQGLLGTRR
jgi:hypothetical protein